MEKNEVLYPIQEINMIEMDFKDVKREMNGIEVNVGNVFDLKVFDNILVVLDSINVVDQGIHLDLYHVEVIVYGIVELDLKVHKDKEMNIMEIKKEQVFDDNIKVINRII